MRRLVCAFVVCIGFLASGPMYTLRIHTCVYVKRKHWRDCIYTSSTGSPLRAHGIYIEIALFYSIPYYIFLFNMHPTKRLKSLHKIRCGPIVAWRLYAGQSTTVYEQTLIHACNLKPIKRNTFYEWKNNIKFMPSL